MSLLWNVFMVVALLVGISIGALILFCVCVLILALVSYVVEDYGRWRRERKNVGG